MGIVREENNFLFTLLSCQQRHPVIEDILAREKQTGLLTCIPHTYMVGTQGKMSNSRMWLLNSGLNTILIGGRGGECRPFKGE